MYTDTRIAAYSIDNNSPFQTGNSIDEMYNHNSNVLITRIINITFKLDYSMTNISYNMATGRLIVVVSVYMLQ